MQTTPAALSTPDERQGNDSGILTRVMEEERIILLRPGHQPRHSPQYIRLGRYAHRVLLVIRQDDHILAPVPVSLNQKVGHVPHVVNASPQLALLPEVVDADQERLALTRAVGVLKRVAGRSTVAELDHARGGRPVVVVAMCGACLTSG